MIANDSGTGKSFIGLAAYLKSGKGGHSPERIEWTAGIHVNDHPGIAASEMRMLARNNTRVDRPVYHYSINWHPEESERVDRDLALEVVKATLDDLGLSEHQALVVAHNDTEHFHVHVMVNRIHPETFKSWKQGLSIKALERSMAQLSLEHGFDIVPGHHNAEELGISPPPYDTALPDGAHWYEDRTGDDSDLTCAREALFDHVNDAITWDDLTERLEPLGFKVEPSGRGMVFRDKDGGFIKASAISRDFARERLEARFKETFNEYKTRKSELELRHGNENESNSIENVETITELKSAPEDLKEIDRQASKERSNQDIAGDVLKSAKGWRELDAELSERGYSIERKGRGFVVKTPEGEIKPSSIDRSLSTKALEQRFNETARDYFRVRSEQQYPIRAKELRATVQRLNTFEQEAAELTEVLKTRDKVFTRTDRTFSKFGDIARAKRDIQAGFKAAYRDPVAAERKLEAFRKKNGMDAAAKMLATKPGKLGPLRGRLVILPEERRQRDAGVKRAAQGFAKYVETVKFLNEHKGQVEKDKRDRDYWKDDANIVKLEKRVGDSINQIRKARVGHERAVIDAAKGLETKQIGELPIRGRLRRTAMINTVERLRTEADERRDDRQLNKEPMPPLTATPATIKAFDAAREYAAAAKDYEWRLHKPAKKAWAIDQKIRDRVTTAADALVNDHPKGLNYISRFGVRKADVLLNASPIKSMPKSKTLTQRLIRFQQQVKETGKGLGVMLSLFQRR